MLLAEVAAAVADVTALRGRVDKAERVAAALSAAPADQRPVVAAWLAGELRQRRTGLGWRSLRDVPPPAADPTLTVAEVDAAFADAAAQAGPGATARRHAMLADLLARATAPEQALLAGLVAGELRQGAARGVLVEAVARAADVPVPAVRRALTLDGDLVRVADLALTGGHPALDAVRLEPGRPLAPMLAQSAPDLAEALRRTVPATVEWKLDGIRVQVHRWQGGDQDGDQDGDQHGAPDGDVDRVAVWTRSLDDVTDRLPEVVAAVRGLPARAVVLDGEVILLDGDDLDTARPRPFQETAARVARRAAGTAAPPLTTVVFDLLHLDGRDLVDAPDAERRAALEGLLAGVEGLAPVPRSPLVPAGDDGDGDDEAAGTAADEAARVHRRALDLGHEGVVVKAAGAPYAAGRRGAAWVKVKPRRTLDLVVLAAEWGSGRRRGTLSNLHLAARDPAGRHGPQGGLVMLGKTFKGLTDEMLAWQTERLLALQTRREGHVVHVAPELVVEIAFDGVQTSPRYPAGLALRFARVLRHRPDKRAEDADTIDAVRDGTAG